MTASISGCLKPNIYLNLHTMEDHLPLGVFWDIENCDVPSGKSAMAVCAKIREQEFTSSYSEVQFTVVCDVLKFTEGRHNTRQNTILEDLDKAQVDIVHVPANKKNAADEKLKQLMRRFADIHRGGGARIVLISGDRDFAADIADYKRRMRLSVILLHTNNCPQSLMLAASEHYNFQELLSSVPVEVRLPWENMVRPTLDEGRTTQATDTVEVSNLPNVSEHFTIADLHKKLKNIANQLNGKNRLMGSVEKVSISQGTALITFPTVGQATEFKMRYTPYRINGQFINIHFYNSLGRRRTRSRSRGGPGGAGRSSSNRRIRTLSESGRFQSGERRPSEQSQSRLSRSRFSSQESLASLEQARERVTHSEPRVIEVCPVMRKLTLESQCKAMSESDLAVSSGEDEVVGVTEAPAPSGAASNRPRRMNARMKSKLKLKSRKKSEATPEFLRKKSHIDDVEDSSDQASQDSNDSDPSQTEQRAAEQIRTNISCLINTHEMARLDLINHLYNESYQSDVATMIHERTRWGSLSEFITEFCPNLRIINFSEEPHVVSRKGPFVQSYLSRVNQVLYKCCKDIGPLGGAWYGFPLPLFERRYKESHGNTAFLDIDLIIENLPGVRVQPTPPISIEINAHFILGNEIVEVVKSRGGVVQLDSFYAAYKSSTAKNLDPTTHGCASLEALIAGYDQLLSLRGRSVILKSVDDQLTEHERIRAQTRPDLISGTRDSIVGARDSIAETRDTVSETRDTRLYQLATCQPGGSNLVSPALRSVRQETMFKGSKLKLTDCIANRETSPVSKRVTMKEEPEVEDMVMMSNSSRDIVTVDTDTSDDQTNTSASTTRTTGPLSTRGRKKSRMAAFPFLE